MKYKFFSSVLAYHIFFVLALFFYSNSYGDIVHGTLVLTTKGYVPVEMVLLGDYVIGCENNAFVKSEVTKISSIQEEVSFVIVTDKGDIKAAENQLFYDPVVKKWIKTKDLTGNSVFIDKELQYCRCKKIIRNEQQVFVYKISTQAPHNLFISDYGILTHNFPPVILGVAFAFGGGFEFAGFTLGTLLGGMLVGLNFYKEYVVKNRTCSYPPRIDFATSCNTNPHGAPEKLENQGDTENPKVLETVLSSSEESRQSQINCTIVIRSQKDFATRCGDSPERAKTARDYVYSKQQNSINGEKRYNGPKYVRTEDWVKDHPFGQKIKGSLERSPYVNQGKRAFKVIKKIGNCDGIEKGEFVVVDALHNDHLEVFSKDKKWSHVTNFDGTRNYQKTKQAKNAFRQPLQKG